MWIEKLAHGILEVDTAIGPRYLQPNLLERALLVWTFRNFSSLPQEVLRASERRLIDRLWNQNRFISRSMADANDTPIIGRVERRAIATVEALPKRKPATASQPALVDEGREALSA
ncbi:MAG: hypothetical protein WCB53_23005 [Terriglobales bacterium]